jgi:hypothetical protein
MTELAVRGSGDYQLAYLYKDKAISAYTWANLTSEKQNELLRKVKKTLPPPRKRLAHLNISSLYNKIK